MQGAVYGQCLRALGDGAFEVAQEVMLHGGGRQRFCACMFIIYLSSIVCSQGKGLGCLAMAIGVVVKQPHVVAHLLAHLIAFVVAVHGDEGVRHSFGIQCHKQLVGCTIIYVAPRHHLTVERVGGIRHNYACNKEKNAK